MMVNIFLKKRAVSCFHLFLYHLCNYISIFSILFLVLFVLSSFWRLFLVCITPALHGYCIHSVKNERETNEDHQCHGFIRAKVKWRHNSDYSEKSFQICMQSLKIFLYALYLFRVYNADIMTGIKYISSDYHLVIFDSQTILSTHISVLRSVFAHCSSLFSKRMGQHLGFMKKPFGSCNLFYRISALLLLRKNNIESFKK